MTSSDGAWTQVLDDADDVTAQLLLKLQLEDLEESTSLNDDSSSAADRHVALNVFATELKQYRGARVFQATAAPVEEVKGAEPTSPAAAEASSNSQLKIPTFECNCCNDRFTVEDCYQVPCQHYYCDYCLDQLFSYATADEGLYPPRCCRQNVPFEDVRLFLTTATADAFAKKREEWDDEKRTYCHVPTCSTYIGQSGKDGTVATCPACATTTCVLCRQASHHGDCAEDQATKEMKELAKSQGWQKCPSCDRMVELNTGCNHMTCLCKAQFCYVCGLRWKNCPCAQFDENRLLERGQQILEREGRGNIHDVMNNLRQNHECVNHSWARIPGVHDCEECGDTLRVFIFRCTRCRTQVCRRCMDNRL